MSSIFNVLKKRGLTTFRIRYDYRTEEFRHFIAKEWDTDTDFSRYNKTFNVGSILAGGAVYLNTSDVLDMLKEHGMITYFKKILELMKQGKHFGIDMLYNDKLNI